MLHLGPPIFAHLRARPWLAAPIFLLALLVLRSISLPTNAPNSYGGILRHPSPSGLVDSLGPCDLVAFPGAGEESREVAEDPEHPGSWPIQYFKTTPFHPPEFQINYTSRPSSPGLIMMEQKSSDPTAYEAYRFGLYIFTDRGDLVWASDVRWVRGLQVQTYHDQPVLTYWSSERSAAKGLSWGSISVLDSTYTQIHTVCPRLGLRHQPGFEDSVCEADLHEGMFTEDSTILITAYNQTIADLSSIGGPSDGWIYDCLAYELDPITSEVLWQWSALEHVPLTASRDTRFHRYPTRGTYYNAWDWFHLNSIQKINNHYLLNSRNTFQTYYVAPAGDVLWMLDGESGGDFGALPARYMSNPSEEHWRVLSSLWAYLDKTPNLGLYYKSPSIDGITGYCDADWGGDLGTRRSTTGYIFLLRNGALSWNSKLQKTVALSSCEAEYMALKEAIKEQSFIRLIATELSGIFKENSITTVLAGPFEKSTDKKTWRAPTHQASIYLPGQAGQIRPETPVLPIKLLLTNSNLTKELTKNPTF